MAEIALSFLIVAVPLVLCFGIGGMIFLTERDLAIAEKRRS